MGPQSSNEAVTTRGSSRVWYWCNGEDRHGPATPQELRELVRQGRITSASLLWKQGLPQWTPATSLRGLFPEAGPAIPETCNPDGLPAASVVIEKAKKQAAKLVNDLREIDYHKDVVPINASVLAETARDTSFWCVLGLSVVPLLIVTIHQQNYQLTMLSLFFALLWGFVFKHVIVRSTAPWGLLCGSMFFTGTCGITGLLKFYTFLPESYKQLAENANPLISLVGFVAQVGLCEEVCKLTPLFAYALWKRGTLNPLTGVMIGVFSGLGFAAFENILYGQKSVEDSIRWAHDHGDQGLAAGVEVAMISVLLRSLSLVFCHAVWSGISAYFVMRALAADRQKVAMFLVGLVLALTLHGVYDWLVTIQTTFATLVVIASFVLFRIYLSQLRLGMED